MEANNNSQPHKRRLAYIRSMHRLDFNKRRELPAVTPDELRQALRQFASGVTIVTAEHDDQLYGITVTAFSSISIDPPVIMVSINNSSPLAGIIIDAEHFAVHILTEAQQELSARFAVSLPGEEKYRNLQIERGASGAPRLAGALAVLECTLDQTLEVGTHTLMFGRVVHANSNPDPDSPLIYYHRSYCGVSRDSST